MLEHLSIKNFTLIESTELDFKEGLIILTGETGSGKSLILKAIATLFGFFKPTKDLIRSGASEAILSAWVKITQTEALNWLLDHNIILEQDSVLIKKIIKNQGRSLNYIQDILVSQSELLEFTNLFCDISSQHEQQRLFKKTYHRLFIDDFSDAKEVLNDYKQYYEDLKKEMNDYNLLLDKEKNLEVEALYYKGVIKDLKQLNLKEGEEESLKEEEKALSSFEKYHNNLNILIEGLKSGVHPMLEQLLPKAKYLEEQAILKTYSDRLKNSYYEIEDLAESYEQYLFSINFSPEKLNKIQTRLAKIQSFKKKYQVLEAQGLLSLLEKAELEADLINNFSEEKKVFENKIEHKKKELNHKAEILSQLRKKGSLILEEQIKEVLSKLAMPNTTFKVDFQHKLNTQGQKVLSIEGLDDIEFLIETNKGEGLKPLRDIASGGELSRIILSLKSILNHKEKNYVLIFDEIDAGLGGEVALNLGTYLKQLGLNNQVLCITHLPHVAAFAQQHLLIYKFSTEDRTYSQVEELMDMDAKAKELSRMLVGGGAEGLHLAYNLLKDFN